MNDPKIDLTDIKNVILNELVGHYQTFTKYIQSLPINEYNKVIAMQFASTAFLWAKEGCIMIEEKTPVEDGVENAQSDTIN